MKIFKLVTLVLNIEYRVNIKNCFMIYNIVSVVHLIHMLFDPGICDSEWEEAEIVFFIKNVWPDRNRDLAGGVHAEGQNTRKEGGSRIWPWPIKEIRLWKDWWENERVNNGVNTFRTVYDSTHSSRYLKIFMLYLLCFKR